MKPHKISIAAAFGGISWIGISTARWFFIYPDMSQWLLSMLIGAIIIAFAYIYNWMRTIHDDLQKTTLRVDSMLSFMFKEDLTKGESKK